jgi:hypothetical protein
MVTVCAAPNPSSTSRATTGSSCSATMRRKNRQQGRQTAETTAEAVAPSIPIASSISLVVRRLVVRTGSAVPANPAHRGQTLLKCCKPAIRRTAAAKIVIGAPPTVLRLSGFFGADNGRENSEQEQQKPHGDLLKTPQFITSTAILCCSCATRTRAIAVNILGSCRSYCPPDAMPGTYTYGRPAGSPTQVRGSRGISVGGEVKAREPL